MRARNLKPGFFQNEQLAELPIAARLLFAGLWLMADREGRLEDRPRRIKMQLFPADTLDIEPLLQGLAEQKLIVRYVVNGVAYIWIPRFLEHQNPHPREAASEFPPCPEQCAETRAGDGRGAEMFHDKPKAADRQDPGNALDLSSPAESLFSESLNPPLPPEGGFADFWEAYPRKIRKAAAMRVWLRKGLNAKTGEIVGHIRERVRSDAQWLAENGRYIPHPATWLNGDGWEDEYLREGPKPRIAGI